jgi:hypothetical protein
MSYYNLCGIGLRDNREKWRNFWELSIAINRNIVSRPKGQVEKYVNVEACWEVYINFILSQFGIERHLLAFSINKRNQYGGYETLDR